MKTQEHSSVQRFDVVIYQENSKGRRNFQATGENIGANSLEDFANLLAEYLKKTVEHYEYLTTAGVHGIRNLKPKISGNTYFQIIWKGDDSQFSLKIKDFGKFVMDNSQAQIRGVIYSQLLYLDEIAYLFVNQSEELLRKVS
jgi:hypothetical protein